MAGADVKDEKLEICPKQAQQIAKNYAEYHMKLDILTFRDRFNILLAKKLSGIAELRYKMLYEKSKIKYVTEQKKKRDVA